jgi:hypothetical protein
MKKLILLSILFIVGCVREYECCPDVIGGEECNSEGDFVIRVSWPQGEKEAEEHCEESNPFGEGVDAEGVSTGEIGCKCEKAD